MRTFDIYPKRGKKFSMDFEKFEYSLDRFILYDSGHQPSREGFLLFDAVAAIIPQNQACEDDVEAFRVFLRNREDQDYVKVHANVFDLAHPPGVMFYTRIEDESQLSQVRNIYVAVSEVVAIIPDKGLHSDRKRSLRGL
jgi:hypothetical protein